MYGIWSLDFFRYAIPPFCISSKLKTTHIIYLQNISTICPFILIGITWVGIELYSRNVKLVVWLWRTLNRFFIRHINIERDSIKTIIDTFATFFLLSYTKLTVLLLLPLVPMKLFNVNNINLSTTISWHAMIHPSVKFASEHHLPYVIISIFVYIIVALPPVFLLALYPVSAFRSLLFKCCRSMASVNIFVEKFYSCYRDGLHGGRDMRSFASLYFIVVLFGYMLTAISTFHQFTISVLLGGFSLLIAIVQPYKKKYMTVIDAVILANMGILSAIYDAASVSTSPILQVVVFIWVNFPLLGLVGYIIYKLFKKPFKKLLEMPFFKSLLCCCQRNIDRKLDGERQLWAFDNEIPDCMLPPKQYMQWGYDSIS